MTDTSEKAIDRVCELYGITGGRREISEITTGHINKTYCLTTISQQEKHSYIFQHINAHVFPDPKLIMDNIRAVTEWIDLHGGGKCEIRRFLPTLDGGNFVVLDDGGFWRVAVFVDNTVTCEMIENADMMRRMGAAFGGFQKQLSGMPTERLSDTIPDFHNTKKRIEYFFNKVGEDPIGRAKSVKEEIDFFREYRDDFSTLENLRESGELPERIIHNDTKCNNILFDKDTGEPRTVIDLDTVMPGLSAYDFGDAVRCAANYAPEDETELEKVGLNMEYYAAFTEGFIGEAKAFLTDAELKYMALGAPTIAFELASRFLADYIDGDKYFRISRERHNLDRARCQIALCRDMMKKRDEMNDAVIRCAK